MTLLGLPLDVVIWGLLGVIFVLVYYIASNGVRRDIKQLHRNVKRLKDQIPNIKHYDN